MLAVSGNILVVIECKLMNHNAVLMMHAEQADCELILLSQCVGTEQAMGAFKEHI